MRNPYFLAGLAFGLAAGLLITLTATPAPRSTPVPTTFPGP